MASGDELVFDGDMVGAITAHDSGTKVLCAKCRAELVFATTLEAAKAAHAVPSVFCPVDRSHLNVLVNLTETRGLLKQLFGPGRYDNKK